MFGAVLYGAVFLNHALRGDGKRSSQLCWVLLCYDGMRLYRNVMRFIMSSCNVRHYALQLYSVLYCNELLYCEQL